MEDLARNVLALPPPVVVVAATSALLVCSPPMGTLLVVRHGQAWGHWNGPIELTSEGAEQARRLGQAWAERRLTVHRALVGPAVRHRQTAQAVVEEFRKAGQFFPTPQVESGLDEYPAIEVARRGVPVVIEQDEELRRLAAAADGDRPEALRNRDRLLGHVMRRYVAGELAFDGVPTFQEFRDGVNRVLQEIEQGGGRGATVVAFTSAGPVAATVGRALGLSDEQVLDLSYVVRHTAAAELRVTRGRFSLLAFNICPHLGAG